MQRSEKSANCLRRKLFQSSPSGKAGCNTRLMRVLQSHSCFNARPALGPSATCRWPGVALYRSVSILTCPKGRCNIDLCVDWPDSRMFQSSPAPRAGATYENSCKSCIIMSFNPHLPPRTDATWSADAGQDSKEGFQSSPAPKADATRRSPMSQIKSSKFQSSPAPKAGATSLRRALRSFSSSFNPR